MEWGLYFYENLCQLVGVVGVTFVRAYSREGLYSGFYNSIEIKRLTLLLIIQVLIMQICGQ